jgi:hypothetical protein
MLKILLLASGFFLLVFQAKAYTIENYQENVEDRFVVSPVNLELNLSPGESISQKMTVVNRLGKTVDFSISKEDFTGSNDPDKSSVLLGEESGGETSAKNWMTPEVDQISLNHGDRLNFSIEIKVPENATPGSHYAGVIVSSGEEDAKSESGSMVKLVSRVGMLILINVPGDIRESGKITEFGAGKRFYRTGPVEFSGVFQNSGNVYEKVRGEVSIKNIWGSEVALVPMKEWVVLSNSSRRQKTEWGRKWMMGRYTAQMAAYYGFGGSLSAKGDSVVFYVFPWNIALLLLVVLVFVYYLLRFFFSKFEIKKKE